MPPTSCQSDGTAPETDNLLPSQTGTVQTDNTGTLSDGGPTTILSPTVTSPTSTFPDTATAPQTSLTLTVTSRTLFTDPSSLPSAANTLRSSQFDHTSSVVPPWAIGLICVNVIAVVVFLAFFIFRSLRQERQFTISAFETQLNGVVVELKNMGTKQAEAHVALDRELSNIGESLLRVRDELRDLKNQLKKMDARHAGEREGLVQQVTVIERERERWAEEREDLMRRLREADEVRSEAERSRLQAELEAVEQRLRDSQEIIRLEQKLAEQDRDAGEERRALVQRIAELEREYGELRAREDGLMALPESVRGNQSGHEELRDRDAIETPGRRGRYEGEQSLIRETMERIREEMERQQRDSEERERRERHRRTREAELAGERETQLMEDVTRLEELLDESRRRERMERERRRGAEAAARDAQPDHGHEDFRLSDLGGESQPP